MTNADKFTIVNNDGYKKEEVDAYVRRLEEQIVQLNDGKKSTVKSEETNVSSDFIAQYQSMKMELDGYREIELKLKEALEAAHTATEKIQEIVETESRRILYEANKNADEIIEKALNESIIALKYIKKMRVDAKVFQKRFEVLVSAQKDFVNQNIWDEILAPIDPYEFVDIKSISDIKNNDDEENK